MSEEEQNELFKKAFANTLRKLAKEYIELCLTEAYNKEETKLPIEYMEQVQIYLEGDKE